MFLSGPLGLPTGGRIDVMLKPAEVTGFYMIDAVIARDWTAFADAAQHLVLPALALGMYSMAIITRMTRSSMLESLNQDYIRTARAKASRAGRSSASTRSGTRSSRSPR